MKNLLILAAVLMLFTSARAATYPVSLSTTNGKAFGELLVNNHINATNTSATNTFAGKFQQGQGTFATSASSAAFGIGTKSAGSSAIAGGVGSTTFGVSSLVIGRSNFVTSGSSSSIVGGQNNSAAEPNELVAGAANIIAGSNTFAAGFNLTMDVDTHNGFLAGQNIHFNPEASNNFAWNGDPLNLLDIPSSQSNSFSVNAPGGIFFYGPVVIPSSNSFVGSIIGDASGATNVPVSGIRIQSMKMLGRTTAGDGAGEIISIGSGLDLSSGTLSATGAGGTATNVLQIKASSSVDVDTNGLDRTVFLDASQTNQWRADAASAALAATNKLNTDLRASLQTGSTTLSNIVLNQFTTNNPPGTPIVGNVNFGGPTNHGSGDIGFDGTMGVGSFTAGSGAVGGNVTVSGTLTSGASTNAVLTVTGPIFVNFTNQYAWADANGIVRWTNNGSGLTNVSGVSGGSGAPLNGTNVWTGTNTWTATTNHFHGDVGLSGLFTVDSATIGTVTAASVSGNASGLTNLNPANLSIGNATLNNVTADGFDTRTNLFVINGGIGLGTNYTYTGGAATWGITGVLNGGSTTYRIAELEVLSTGDIVFTNPVAFYASDGLDSRTLTNGNLTTIAVKVTPGFSTNLVFSWSK